MEQLQKHRKSFRDCLIKTGEDGPFTNLLVDLAFKKAFDPDKPTSRENLINLLNDLLEPQLKRPIRDVMTRSVAKNLSGSRESRSAIFDLHCEDDAGDLIEIEVQIRKLKNFRKRLAFYASEMVANQAEPGQDWRFRFLNRLKDLPAELAERKFELLTESSKVSNLSKEEFQEYLAMYHKEWDHNAMVEGVFEEFADEINAKVSESVAKGVAESKRETAKSLRMQGVADSIIATATGLTEAEVKAL